MFIPQTLLGVGARSILSRFILQDEKNQLNSQHLVKLPRSEDLKLNAAVTIAYVKDVCHGVTYLSFTVNRE